MLLNVLLFACSGDEKVQDLPPSSPQVSIIPESPGVDTDLQVSVVEDAVDPEGNEVSYEYIWSVDGQTQEDLTTEVVGAERLISGQQWQVEVIPSDGKNTGEAAVAQVTINNTPPEITLEALAETYTTTEDIPITFSIVDIDNDEISYQIIWQQDGETTEFDTDTLPSSATSRGQQWQVQVVADDGQDLTPSSTLAFEIVNTPPEVISVEGLSQTHTTWQPLTVQVDAIDVDGDDISLSFVWTVNGVEQYAGEQPAVIDECTQTEDACCLHDGTPSEQCFHVLSNTLFQRGDAVEVLVTPSDDLDTGLPVSWSTSVENATPVIEDLTITPDPLYATDTATCVYSTFDDPDNDSDASTVQWTSNGVVLGIDETLNVLQTGLVYGDLLTCSATPNDGVTEGVVVDVTIAIANSPPIISSVSVASDTNSNMNLNSKMYDLICTPNGTTDADGHTALTYTYTWFVDGVDVGVTAESLSKDYFNKGNEVVCSVAASDGYDVGASVSSVPLVIENAIPSIAEIIVDPAVVTSATSLSCTYSGYQDADVNDPDQTLVEWLNNNSVIATGQVFDIPSSSLQRGDYLVCRITPYDGEAYGSPFMKNLFINNAMPTISNIYYSPNPVRTNDTLQIHADISDPEGDEFEVSYSWYVDGIEMSFQNTDSLDGTIYFDKGQQVHVEIHTTDPFGSYTTAIAAITVANTAPPAPVISLNPYNVYPTDNLSCIVDEQPTDEDADPLTYEIVWQKNGQPYNGPTLSVYGVTGDTIAAADTVLTDNWHCSMTVIDVDGDTSVTTTDIDVCPLGQYEECIAESCNEIYVAGYADPDADGTYNDGQYYIDPDGTGHFYAYCDMNGADGGWTMLLSADGNSTYWGSGSTNWDQTGSDDAPLELAEEDRHLVTYSNLPTDEIKLCHTDTEHCFVFTHNLGIPLHQFFSDDITHVEFSYNVDGYDDFDGGGSLGDFETGMGYDYYVGDCNWLGINEQFTNSGLGFLGDDDTVCSDNAEIGTFDDHAVGLGMYSHRLLNTGNLAGQQSGTKPNGNLLLSPWFVFGR